MMVEIAPQKARDKSSSLVFGLNEFFATADRFAWENLAQRALGRIPSEVSTTWEDILIPHGLSVLSHACKSPSCIERITEWADYHLEVPHLDCEPDYDLRHSSSTWRGFVFGDYCGDWGAPLALAPIGIDQLPARHVELVDRCAKTILTRGSRLSDGAIAHGYTSSADIWVDTLFYTASPLAHAYALLGDNNCAEEAVKQCLLHAKYLLDADTGMYFHDYQVSNQRRTSWLWSRGNGWMILAFADVLDLLPNTTPGYAEVLQLYKRLATALLRVQSPSGMWRAVLDDAESNLETSGTSLILAGLCVGLRNRWLEPSNRLRVDRGMAELGTWIRHDGALMGCQYPAGRGGWETHKLAAVGERTYGTGAALRCLGEYLMMKKHLSNHTIQP